MICEFMSAKEVHSIGKVLIQRACMLGAQSDSGIRYAQPKLARGLPSWPKAQDLRSCLAGVRGFESRTPHCSPTANTFFWAPPCLVWVNLGTIASGS